MNYPEVLGTIAGDDTIFIASRSAYSCKSSYGENEKRLLMISR
jgi:arginine repressor